MALEVEHCKAAYVSKAIDMHGKLAEKVDDRGGALGQGPPQHERRQDHRQQLLQEHDRLHLKQHSELGVDLRPYHSVSDTAHDFEGQPLRLTSAE